MLLSCLFVLPVKRGRMEIKMNCPYCKNEISDGSLFCPKCGQPICDQEKQSTIFSTYWNEVGKERVRDDKKRIDTEKKTNVQQKKKDRIFLFSLIFVFVAVVILIVFIGFDNKYSLGDSDNIINSEISTEYIQSSETETIDKKTTSKEQETKLESGEEVVIIDESVVEDKNDFKKVNGISTDAEYIIEESNSRYLSESDLYGLSDEELMLARNEIYARHGRLFNDSSIQAYFDSKAWYNGYIAPDEFDTSVFNKYENSNISFIKEHEQ